jgi:hypothetical protein
MIDDTKDFAINIKMLGRSLEMEDLSQGAANLIQTKPAEYYVYGHFSMYEDVVQQLRTMGKTIYRYLNTHDTYYEAVSWLDSWEHRMITAMEQYNLYLRDSEGNHLHFRWYGQGPILDWSKVTPTAMNYLTSFILEDFPERSGSLLFFDQAWREILIWMLLEGVDAGGTITQQQLDTFYDKELYKTKYLEFISRFSDKTVVLNGQSDWDQQGRLCMFENADNDFYYNWTDVLTRWQNHPGCMLELNSPIGYKYAEAMAVWEQKGGLIHHDF